MLQKILVLIVLLGVCTAAVVEVIGKPGIPAKPKEDELVTAETQRQFGGGHGGYGSIGHFGGGHGGYGGYGNPYISVGGYGLAWNSGHGGYGGYGGHGGYGGYGGYGGHGHHHG